MLLQALFTHAVVVHIRKLRKEDETDATRTALGLMNNEGDLPAPEPQAGGHAASVGEAGEAGGEAGERSCRICFAGEEEEIAIGIPPEPLISPCLCRGSMRYVHPVCLTHRTAVAL